MISQHLIVRLIEAREYRQLIDRILANGRCRSPLAKRTLMQAEAAEVAAIGLAIQRICEITYRPAPQAAALVERLLQLQREDGTFNAAPGADHEVILAATAVAIRALISYQAQASALGLPGDSRVHHANARGVAALERAAASCLNQRMLDAPACWAIILWQLGDVAEFRQNICVEAILDLLNACGAEIIEEELARYAHAMAA